MAPAYKRPVSEKLKLCSAGSRLPQGRLPKELTGNASRNSVGADKQQDKESYKSTNPIWSPTQVLRDCCLFLHVPLQARHSESQLSNLRAQEAEAGGLPQVTLYYRLEREHNRKR